MSASKQQCHINDPRRFFSAIPRYAKFLIFAPLPAFCFQATRALCSAAMRRILEVAKSPLSVGLSVGTAFFIFILSVADPTRCKDGWASPSIGRRGACSHHGGVGTTPGSYGLPLSIFLGWIAGALRQRTLDKRRSVELERLNEKEKEAARAQGIACPVCGFHLVRRRARRGKNKGGYFMGCSRYPTCRGTRDLTPEEALAIPKPQPRRRNRNS